MGENLSQIQRVKNVLFTNGKALSLDELQFELPDMPKRQIQARIRDMRRRPQPGVHVEKVKFGRTFKYALVVTNAA